MKLSIRIACVVLAALTACAAPAFAQESKSAPLAKQLAAALDAAKLDSVAARDANEPGVFHAALYFPGMQLLAISGAYSAPQVLDHRMMQKEYREIYLDLNGAATAKVLVEDAGIDGLKPKREKNQAFDQFEAAGKRTLFDGEWKAKKMSEQDYMKAFEAADERYAQILTAFLAQLKK